VTPPSDLIELFIRPLERLGVEYMITGGVAGAVYGDPRFTGGVDLVLDLDADGSCGIRSGPLGERPTDQRIGFWPPDVVHGQIHIQLRPVQVL